MGQKISINSTINLPKDTVWKYYTSPEHIIHWNFADPSWHCPSAENDMKVGGKYKARMEAKDGSFGFDFEAIYTSLSQGNNFVYRMEDGRESEVVFTDLDGKTELQVTFDAESQNSIDLQRNGWQTILDNFKRYAETLSMVENAG